MNFADAVKVCFTKYADFSGRASKPEFWWWTLFTFVGGMALGVISDKVSAAFFIATLLPSLAVGSRRLHDIGRSGWQQLWTLVPIVGWLLLLYWLVQDSKEPNGLE